MTHQRFVLMLPGLVAIACGGGDGSRVSADSSNAAPPISNQPPKGSDQLPVITGTALPGGGNMPGGVTPGGTCEGLCQRTLDSACAVQGGTDCRAACATLAGEPCLAEVLSLWDCEVSAGLCPGDVDKNSPLIEERCSSQALSYARCVDQADGEKKD